MVSVIIPTLNAEHSIGTLLHSLREQSVKTEQIVIDSDSDDRTIMLAQKGGARTIQVRRKDFDHGATRNQAAAIASGDTLVFMTQDALPVNSLLIELLTAPLKDNDIAASYARQIPYDDAPPPEKFARFFNYPVQQVKKSASTMPDMGIKTFFFSNVCSAIRRDVFQNMKGFPEGVIMNEDLLFAAKVIRDGQSIAYVPEAQVFHSHNYGFFRQFRRYFDIGVCFRDNKEALDGVTVGNEGMKFVIEEFRYLCTQRHFGWLPYSALELMCRYGGFVCGKSYTIFPAVLKKQMSLHRNYWD